MKKHIYKIIMGLLIASGLYTTSCTDNFSDINADPTKTDSDFRYLFTKGLERMNGNEYTPWFWNYRTSMPWTQITASSGGNTDGMALMSELSEEFEFMINVKKQVEGIKYKRKGLPEADALIYTHLEAMCTPMVIYMGIKATDASGSIPYSEAGKAYYEGESAFRPKFDSQKELIDLWLEELKKAVVILNSDVLGADGKAVPQLIIGAQDFVYGGDAKKWAKFANSLRLKLAVRLMHQDKAKAFAIVEDAMKYPLMSAASDNFVWNPGSRWANTENSFQVDKGSIQIVSFLVKNKDPRVRFIFAKNNFNENIVNGFLAEGKRLPSYIDKYVERTTKDGKEEFAGWKDPGEPWVRYHGVPVDVRSKEYPENMQDYYISSNFVLGTGSDAKSYTSTSSLNEPMLRGQYTFNYPSRPKEPSKRDDALKAISFAYMTSAEVNLYLAELKVLDAPGINGNAATYYQNAIRESVEMYNNLASLNKIPYYHETTGLPTDVSIKLQSGEIDNLLAQADCQLTGSKREQLERIYIQQYIHFALAPQDLFTTMRRSGVPIKGSSYYPLLTWDTKQGHELTIPRRFIIKSLAETDELYQNRKEALEEQGLTPGKNDPLTLSTERLWLDKTAPEYGTGPKY